MKKEKGRIDWLLTIVPFVTIWVIAGLLVAFPDRANEIISQVRFFFGDTLGLFYLVMGVGVLLVSLFMSFSKYGNIKLGGKDEKPKYSFFTWGAMMFTCGLAADIIFYSFIEWVMYATNPHLEELGGSILEWAAVYPLFHWSFIPWAFYLVLAVAFGYMLHCRKKERQRYSEACIPVIGEKRAHGKLGRFIDLFAIFALLAGTATTFSVATPLMAEIFTTLFGVDISRTTITILILIITCIVYTYSVTHGFKGMGISARICTTLFFGLLVIVLLFGGQGRFIIENGLQSMGKMVQEFIGLSTYTDPMRTSNFPQDWTIYYWAYWMVWCIAAPFFIGKISRGRTIKQTILGGYVFGVGSTLVSFIVLGNYGLGIQASGATDFIAQYNMTGDLYTMIIEIIKTMPVYPVFMAIILLSMLSFYTTSFDSIAYMAACYSYKRLGEHEKPNVLLTMLWCILLIVLPIAMVFSESTMNNIQSISIISAFPIGIVMVIMIWSFFKDARKDFDKN